MAKGKADRHPLLRVCSIFAGLILRDGVQIRLYIFGFLGPLGLDSGRFTTPFLKCVFSNFSKKTNNPNPSPTGKNGFGLYWSGAGDRTRTGTLSPAVDFESTTSTIPSHRHLPAYYIILAGKLQEKSFPIGPRSATGRSIWCTLRKTQGLHFYVLLDRKWGLDYNGQSKIPLCWGRT